MKAEEKGTHKEKVEAMQKKFDVRNVPDCVCVCVCVCMCVCMCVRACVHMCVHVCVMCVCVYLCVYVPMYKCEIESLLQLYMACLFMHLCFVNLYCRLL